MEQTFELIAKTFQGLEEVLAQELTELGADDVQIGRRMVAFRGNQEMMYRANFCLRTAVRILKPILHFQAKNADEVYTAVQRIDWSKVMTCSNTFAIDTTVYSENFRNSKFVAYRVKDAIVDQFLSQQGKRPNISITHPDIRINMHIADDKCTLSLDSSGESLHQRGYRVASVEAPINEVLAAALIKMSGWDGTTDFIDPFCGSGTLLVEAALIARNIYPGVFRRSFGFEAWPDFNAELLSSIFEDDSQEREFTGTIQGYDLNLRAIEAAQANAKSAGVIDIIRITQQDIADFQQPDHKAIIITNPPYGERLRPESLEELYATLGSKLKRAFTGGEAWVISSREELFDAMRLRPSFKVPLQNGALDCELRKFVSFEGKLENFRAEGGEVKTATERQRMGEHGRFKDGRKREFSRKRTSDNGDNFSAASPFKTAHFADEAHRNDLPSTEEDLELARKYRVLQNRHKTFERVQQHHNKAHAKPSRNENYDKKRKAAFATPTGEHKKRTDFRPKNNKKWGTQPNKFDSSKARFGNTGRAQAATKPPRRK